MRRLIFPCAVAATWLGFYPAAADASRGCNTRACEKRVCRSAACHGRVARKALARRPRATAIASVYGPGLYGNRTACGQTLSPGTVGVAHKGLACGTRVRFCANRCATVPVIDRGPYVAGRTFDLTVAAAGALGLGVAVHPVRFRVLG